MERDGFKVFVRGKWVSFNRTTINNFYRLNNVDDDEYHTLIKNDVPIGMQSGMSCVEYKYLGRDTRIGV